MGLTANADIPCNVTGFLKIRNGKLEWMQVMRSNDLYRGVPYNVVQFTFLQEIMAGWLGVEVGTYHQLSDSLHLYTADAGYLSLRSEALATNTDSVSLPKAEFYDVLMKLEHYIDCMTKADFSESALQASLASTDLPMAYRNLLYVVTAEAARRRGWSALAHEAMADCTNPLLHQIWRNWLERFLPPDQAQCCCS